MTEILCDKCYKPFFTSEYEGDYVYLKDIRNKYMEHINSEECRKVSASYIDIDLDKRMRMGF